MSEAKVTPIVEGENARCPKCGLVTAIPTPQIRRGDRRCRECRNAQERKYAALRRKSGNLGNASTSVGRSFAVGFNNTTPLLERFESKFIPEPNSGCWLWVGAASATDKAGRDLRGRITHNGRLIQAHRASYELFCGPIRKGDYVCHKCDVPLCVNPDHLYLGNAKTNSDDALARGRHVSIRHKSRLGEFASKSTPARVATRSAALSQSKGGNDGA